MKPDASRRGKEMAMTARPKLCTHSWFPALLLVVALASPARAGQDTWTPFGPGGGALQSLAASPSGELYVTTGFTTTEIWQRPLATAPWRWRNNGLGLPQVVALAVDPKNPSSLWAASGNSLQQVFHSAD